MTFGEKLKNLRQSRFITQQKLAEALNISQAAIASYENNIREPSFNIIQKFADYFHVPFSSLTPSEDKVDADTFIRISESLKSNKSLLSLFEIAMTLDEDKINVLLTVAKSYGVTNT